MFILKFCILSDQWRPRNKSEKVVERRGEDIAAAKTNVCLLTVGYGEMECLVVLTTRILCSLSLSRSTNLSTIKTPFSFQPRIIYPSVIKFFFFAFKQNISTAIKGIV